VVLHGGGLGAGVGGPQSLELSRRKDAELLRRLGHTCDGHGLKGVLRVSRERRVCLLTRNRRETAGVSTTRLWNVLSKVLAL